jgi:hypothetical protein
VSGTAFDLPDSLPAKPVVPVIRDPRIDLRASWGKPEVDEPMFREVVPPPAHLILDTSSAKLDPFADLAMKSPVTPPAASRFDAEDDLFQKMSHIPPRNAELSWMQKTLGYLPSAPTLLAIAACGIFAIVSVSVLALPSVANSPSSEGGASMAARFANFRSALRSRASIRLQDDFRSGLSAWEGPSGWAKDWSYDQAGSLRPGKFGLWRKSMSLIDYKFEMLGQIERKSIGWVFRAQDTSNYYAAKITISKPGPLPLADFVRYAVTNGETVAKSAVRLPFSVRNDTIYQVQMDIRGNHFTTKINGRIVDSWVDASHPRGGVGLISDMGEQARVRWMRVSHRDDFIGRICSYLTAEAFIPQDDVHYAETITLEDGSILYIR